MNETNSPYTHVSYDHFYHTLDKKDLRYDRNPKINEITPRASVKTLNQQDIKKKEFIDHEKHTNDKMKMSLKRVTPIMMEHAPFQRVLF